MTTIFTKIINRELTAQFVYEDDICSVFMDKFPAVDGQTLIVPKQEVDYIFDLPEEIYNHLFTIANKVAKASDQAFDVLRTCIVVEGFEVPHAHIKLYPMSAEDKNLGLIISKPREKSDEELEVDASKIKNYLEK